MDLQDAETQVLVSHGAVIGEEAHIRSGREEGPRFAASYDRVDEYENLILLCPTHHTIIDKNAGVAWSVEALVDMKANHEAAVEAALEPFQARARELEERLTASVEVWANDLLELWEPTTWSLLQAYPRISAKSFQLLMDRGVWLLAKDWPASHEKLQTAFGRWRLTVTQLVIHINETFEPIEKREEILELVREHKRMGRVDEVEYGRRFQAFLLNCVVLWWLTIELTRATNLVIQAVRLDVDPLYRFEEGIVLLRDGDIIRGDKLIRLEYEEQDWSALGEAPSREDVIAAVQAEFKAHGYERYDEVNPYLLDVPAGFGDTG